MEALDGSSWVLEVSDASGYTIEEIANPLRVTDAEPKEKKQLEASGFKLDAFVAVCRFLIKYAPMDPDTVY